MTNTATQPDPTADWLAENFSLDTPWRRPVEPGTQPPAVDSAPVAPVAVQDQKWRRTRAAARVAGEAVPYVSGALWLYTLGTALSDITGE